MRRGSPLRVIPSGEARREAEGYAVEGHCVPLESATRRGGKKLWLIATRNRRWQDFAAECYDVPKPA